MTVLGHNMTDRDPVTAYNWAIVGESEKAAARKTTDLSETIWLIRNDVIDAREDDVMPPIEAMTVIQALRDAANLAEAGGDPTEILSSTLAWLGNYQWLARQVQEVLEKTCSHDWVDASYGSGDDIHRVDFCRKCGKELREDEA